MDMQTAVNVAINTPSGTPPFFVASNICQMRGVDPLALCMTIPLQNWQFVIVEQLLGAALADMILSSFRPPIGFPFSASERDSDGSSEAGETPKSGSTQRATARASQEASPEPSGPRDPDNG